MKRLDFSVIGLIPTVKKKDELVSFRGNIRDIDTTYIDQLIIVDLHDMYLFIYIDRDIVMNNGPYTADICTDV